MKFFNTLTRQKEDFTPLSDTVKIYACGPTVYNFIHIGNARPLITFDILRGYLKYRGYNVKFVQNFTDIDDKLINKANEENCSVEDIADKFIAEFWTDAKGLNVKEADVHPKATENIDEIIAIISELINKGYAYATDDGDVYFRTSSFNEYGKLSHMPLDDLISGARIEVNSVKENPLDFALWKAAKPGEPFWSASWGNGRPGWHIECSAMARRYLGETIDIHCGGQDLIFPHHENEIAQSECCNDKTFARFWVHNGYINVDNKKMSKSLNNFFTVRDVANAYGYEPIRFLMLASHYRSPINYSTDIILQCKSALDRLYSCKNNLAFALNNSSDEPSADTANLKAQLDSFKAAFITAMDDDLNTADALAAIFDLTKFINLNILSSGSKPIISYANDLFLELTSVLRLLYVTNSNENDDLTKEVEDLINKRNEARKAKDFAEADRIRDKLKDMNVILEDTKDGVKWHIKS